MSDSPAPARVLVVDDDRILRQAWRTILASDEFDVHLAESGEQACAHLAREPTDVVITDVRMGGMSGLDLLEYVMAEHRGVEVIVMTGFGNVPDAVKAIRLGAFDYITKPFPDIDACIHRVRQAARLKRMRDELESMRVDPDRVDVLQTRSPRMRAAVSQIRRVAQVDATVLITGPTGAGKSAIAQAVHQMSRRREAEFVYVDCGLTPDLIESKLFGHLRGAFTNAVSDKEGLFRVADKGTIFLDEVGNMPLDVQPKLLRVLNDGCFKPLGSARDVAVDVRVISATNESLEAKVSAGEFRQDLYQRLNVIEITLPSLNERREDIPLLATGMVRRLARRYDSPVRCISPACLELLLAYDWSGGNIRELENTLERAVVFATDEELSPHALPPRFRDSKPPMPVRPEGVDTLLDVTKPWNEAVPPAEEALRATYLRGVLDLYDGNIKRAADHADRDRANFRRLLKRYVPEYREQLKRK